MRLLRDLSRVRPPASVVDADDTVVAFMDIQPATTGHLLIIPRAHAEGLADLDPELGRRLFATAQMLAGALRRSRGVRCDGVNLFLADGEVAFQEVSHVHLHVVPRWPDDGFLIDARWRRRPRNELDETAAAVRAALGGQ